PQIAHVGLNEKSAQEQHIAIETFVKHFDDVDRPRTDGETEGFVKIHVKKGTDKIVGATIVASEAGEMINEITTAMVGGMGLKKLATVIHPYPVQAEAIKKIADGYNRTRLTPVVKWAFKSWMAWLRR
ncbi:MAG: FAD-containing oxidoreductase, partial [Caldilineaceae bacterium]|nr:FAD-containing oxidoreductase [Caldilineaceae bacterium]